MAKYVIFFSYTPQAWAAMIQKPGDRTAAARAVAEHVGGRLESVYFMFGERDGMAIFDAPGAEEAAAVAIAVGSTGAFRSVQSHELIEPERLSGILDTAGRALGAYSPPGA
ncbi:GYD domain-containing protein [Pseudonocardia saturnea]